MRGAILCFAILLMPAAMAGTPEQPEQSDPAGDQRVLLQESELLASLLDWSKASDVIAIWVDNETATTFRLNIQVTDYAAGADAEDHECALMFDSDEDDHVAFFVLWRLSASHTPELFLHTRSNVDGGDYLTGSGDEIGDLPGERADNTFWAEIPRDLVNTTNAGDYLRGWRGFCQMSMQAALINALDWAPDEGLGEARYVFTTPLPIEDVEPVLPDETADDTEPVEQPQNGVPEEAQGDSNPSLTNSTTAAIGNETTPADEDAPMAAWAPLVAVLMAVIAIRRRL